MASAQRRKNNLRAFCKRLSNRTLWSRLFQKNGDWAVIDQRDLHVRAKMSGLHMKPLGAELLDKIFIQGFGDGARRGLREAGTPPVAGVRIESELADGQDFSADLLETAVQLAVLVFEDPEIPALFGQEIRVFLGVRVGDADEKEEAATALADDFTVNSDSCFRNTLQENAHGGNTRVRRWRQARPA